MTFETCLVGIHSRQAFSTSGPTLDRIRRLMERLGNPQERFRAVHIAGTNGKGSVSAMIAAALQESGFRTGLFTSPYLVDFRERIQIDGELISRTELVHCFETVMEQELALERQDYEPVNEFELVTAIGFLAFSRARVDYAVLEVGLGGRTDPTNLVSHPAVCCITPVALDHTAVLGNTIREIAGEKAGIIKPKCPVVCSRQTEEALGIFRRTAEALSAPLVLTESVTPIFQNRTGSGFLCGDDELYIPLLGQHQMENAATAWTAAKLLGLPEKAVCAAFRNISWPGRLQYIPGCPDLLIDAGHNPAGIAALCETLDRLFPTQRIIAVMAMMRDKDYGRCIPMVARRAALLIGATVQLPRSLRPEVIAQTASLYCPAFTAKSVTEGILLAKKHAGAGDLILICGSVYGAGKALGSVES